MKKQKTPKAVNQPPTSGDTAVQPTIDAIAKRAHEIYLARGGTHGSDLDDWLQAERQLKGGTDAPTQP
jgi:hypothetical protein